VAEKINERVEIAAVWRVYAQLAVHDGDHEAARDWYKKAIDMFAMIGSRYELAATRYLAAASGIYRNGERRALLYMAREYFAGEDVRHYVDKIDTELARVRRQSNLQSMPIHGAPRADDIPLLVEHFLNEHNVSTDGHRDDFDRLAKILSNRRWPGNVRQLEAEIKRLTVTTDRDIARMIEFAETSLPSEREELLQVLQEVDWNRREAARRLGVSDSTIRNKIKKFNLHEYQPR